MPSDYDRKIIKRNIIKLLEDHQGPDNCIKMADLHHFATGENIIPSKKTDQSRIIRAIITELRREGMPIGNRGGKYGGYFLARNPKELKPTERVFHKRAMSSLQQEAYLKRAPFKDVLAQHQLEFETQENQDNGKVSQ
ncbi:MAG TPA: hypothetical protein ENI80_03460 [Acidiferrobacteraceae bacterium]|nr:hypothetical protein [Acidiferrobacteraceae bacterium]